MDNADKAAYFRIAQPRTRIHNFVESHTIQTRCEYNAQCDICLVQTTIVMQELTYDSKKTIKKCSNCNNTGRYGDLMYRGTGQKDINRHQEDLIASRRDALLALTSIIMWLRPMRLDVQYCCICARVSSCARIVKRSPICGDCISVAENNLHGVVNRAMIILNTDHLCGDVRRIITFTTIRLLLRDLAP